MIPPPSPDLIDNLKTRLTLMGLDGIVLPMTVNDGPRTCYICCPSEAYLAYAHEELRHFSGHPWLKALMGVLIEAARPLLALSGLDRQVQPNNWLVSTNIVPDISEQSLKGATDALTAVYRTHAVVWRSVSDIDGDKLRARFEAAGYQALPARRVNIYDARKGRGITHRDEKRDLKCLNDGQYRVCGPEAITPKDHKRLSWLYARLYLEKYTTLNPAYSAKFLRKAHESGLIEFHILKNADGRIDGVLGLFSQNGVMTAPIVGYDTDLPQELGLYRRLMAVAFSLARERKALFNMSAGAARFKHARGAYSVFEYNMVYVRHLGWHRRLAVNLMQRILETVGKPLLERFEL